MCLLYAGFIIIWTAQLDLLELNQLVVVISELAPIFEVPTTLITMSQCILMLAAEVEQVIFHLPASRAQQQLNC